MRQDGIIELLKCIFEFIAKSMIHEFTKTYMIARLAAWHYLYINLFIFALNSFIFYYLSCIDALLNSQHPHITDRTRAVFKGQGSGFRV